MQRMSQINYANGSIITQKVPKTGYDNTIMYQKVQKTTHDKVKCSRFSELVQKLNMIKTKKPDFTGFATS